MSRPKRLLDLIQILRRYRQPVSGQTLADELGVSVRIVYRDIRMLIGQGTLIDGDADIGFVLRPGFLLPPLVFTDDEIEALALGLRLAAQQTDGPLARAAADATAKIAGVLPEPMRDRVADIGLLVGSDEDETRSISFEPVYTAINAEQKLAIGYVDREGDETRRIIWPIELSSSEMLRCWLRGVS